MAGGPKNGLEACLLSGTDLVGYPSIVERPSIAPTLVGRAKSVDFGGSPRAYAQEVNVLTVCYESSSKAVGSGII